MNHSVSAPMAAQSPPVAPGFRRPRRISITLPHHVVCSLQGRSDDEGRSLSNLAAYLLECSLEAAAATTDLGLA